MLFTPAGSFYSKVQFKTEEEVEKVVARNFKLLFGDYSILLPKSLIRTSGGKGREAQGLSKPEYRQDAFILKAIVKNSGFGSKNLGIGDKNLGCAPATATNLIKRMKTLNIVKPVVGAGKGKYVLRRAK